MIRIVPIVLMLGGLLLVWFLKPPWLILIAVTVIFAILAWLFPPNKKYYE